MALILQEPGFIRQKKAMSCWFACLKMLLQWHEGSRSIGDAAVSDLASWIHPRSYGDIPLAFRARHGLEFRDQALTSVAELEDLLRRYGPFMGGGKVGKALMAFGPRMFGHAILIYGVTANGLILHHDPQAGAHHTIKWANYERLQDGELLLKTNGPRVVQVAAGGG